MSLQTIKNKKAFCLTVPIFLVDRRVVQHDSQFWVSACNPQLWQFIWTADTNYGASCLSLFTPLKLGTYTLSYFNLFLHQLFTMEPHYEKRIDILELNYRCLSRCVIEGIQTIPKAVKMAVPNPWPAQKSATLNCRNSRCNRKNLWSKLIAG